MSKGSEASAARADAIALPEAPLQLAPGPEAPIEAGRLATLARTLAFPLGLFAFTRAAYLGCSYIGMILVPKLYMHEAGRQAYLQPHPMLDGLCRWDCGWFDILATQGYGYYETAKVFPLFPLLGWAIQKATGLHHLLVFILLSNLASLASYGVIYALFRELEGEAAARWGLTLFAAYPFAYYQAAAYPESTMVLASALSLWLALRRRHLWAGTVLGLGVMARHLTLSAGAGLLAAQLRQRGFRPRAFLLHPAVLGLLIPWLFIGAFAIYLKYKLGDPLAFWHSRTLHWGDAVWYSVRQIVANVSFRVHPEYYFYIVFAAIPTAGAAMLAWQRRHVELAAQAVCLMAVVLGSGGVGLGRYSASCYPAFLPLGLWLSRRPQLQSPVLVMLALFQGLFFFLFSHQWPVL